MGVTHNMKEEELAMFNEWSKKQIYDAYLTEHYARVRAEDEIKRLNRQIAHARFLANRAKSGKDMV